MQPDTDDIERVRRALGAVPLAWRSVPGHGAPSTRRFVVELPRGGTAFVKIAAFDYAADWFRDERLAYDALDGMPYLPRLLGWDDDGEAPLLALEDLSGARWPPPWDGSSVNAVLTTLDALHATTPRCDLPTADERQFGLDSWPDVVADPAPFLATGICSPEWLTKHLPALATASAAARIDGEHVLHCDVRSDNVCLTEAGRAWWTGITHASATRSWIQRPGSRASSPREARSRKTSSRQTRRDCRRSLR